MRYQCLVRIGSSCLSSAVVAAALALSVGGASAQPVVISGLSTNPDGGDDTDPLAVSACNGAPQTGVVYRNSETEPYLAVNPVDPDNMIAGWHQDRWSTGGGQSLGVAYTVDGGASWAKVILPFTRCSGGTGKTGAYERASDPWISFSPDGTAHYMALSFDDSVSENALLESVSEDGGATWSTPVVIKRSPAQDGTARSIFNDKNSLTADPSERNDPSDPDLVYATWTLFRTGVTSLMVARSTNGGETWGPAIPIATYGTTAPAEIAFFRQGAQIVVLPDGTLVDAFFRILFNQQTFAVTYEQALFRSTDQGKHWERMDIAASEFNAVFAQDPELSIPVRDAGEIPDIAVGPDGSLYLVWQDANANSAGLAGVYISRSTDGGFTWSAPVVANPNSPFDDVQTFLPAVAVNDSGFVGVLFYDFRNDTLGDDPLSTDVWLSVFSPDLTFIDEHRLTPDSFDLRQAPLAGGRGYFPGDYVGLDTAGDDFVAAFTVTNDLGLPVDFPQNNNGVFVDSNNRNDIVFTRTSP